MSSVQEKQQGTVSEHSKAAFDEGFRTGRPTLLGIAAWSMVVGIAMAKAHLSIPQALAMTLLVFSGSAQLASLPLMAVNAPVWVIFATAMVLNLRFVIFSALMAPHFKNLSWKERMSLGYLSGDMAIGLFIQRYPSDNTEGGKASYLKGLVYPNWLVWQLASIAGIFLGSQVPPEWGFAFAGTLSILCIAIPLVANRAALCGVAVAGGVALIGNGWPYKLGLLAAVIVGMLTAMAIDEFNERISP